MLHCESSATQNGSTIVIGPVSGIPLPITMEFDDADVDAVADVRSEGGAQALAAYESDDTEVTVEQIQQSLQGSWQNRLVPLLVATIGLSIMVGAFKSLAGFESGGRKKIPLPLLPSQQRVEVVQHD